MGAHVWAFGYLRDVLLPDLRFSGWAPDWYAGFPVFRYYMVVPFLAMVVVNSGLVGAASILPAGGSLASPPGPPAPPGPEPVAVGFASLGGRGPGRWRLVLVRTRACASCSWS